MVIRCWYRAVILPVSRFAVVFPFPVSPPRLAGLEGPLPRVGNVVGRPSWQASDGWFA